MAFHISISDKKSRICREYNEGIKLDNRYEVGLKSFVTYNSIYNITEKNNEFKWIYALKDKTKDKIEIITKLVLLEPGVYELEMLLEKMLDERPPNQEFNISLDKHTMKIRMSGKMSIDFTSPTSVGEVLGFEKILYIGNIIHISSKPVDIFSINMIRIKCNLVHNNIDNFKFNDNTLYEFPLDSKSGEKIIERPISPTFYKVNIDTLHDLHLTVVDQDNNLIDFRGEKINILLEFRPSK